MEKTINQIPEGATVTIKVMIGKKPIMFKADVIGSQQSESKGIYYVLTKPIESNGRRLGFRKYKVELKYYDNVQNRTYTYNIESVDYTKTYYCFYSKDSKSPDNTRKAFRVNCGYRTTISLKQGLESYSGFCKNISFVGAGVFIQGEEIVKGFIGTPCTLSIIDKDMKESYLVRGTVVRMIHTNQFGTMIGVEFSVTPKSITDLVNRLQMKDLKRQSGYHSRMLKAN